MSPTVHSLKWRSLSGSRLLLVASMLVIPLIASAGREISWTSEVIESIILFASCRVTSRYSTFMALTADLTSSVEEKVMLGLKTQMLSRYSFCTSLSEVGIFLAEFVCVVSIGSKIDLEHPDRATVATRIALMHWARLGSKT